MVKKKRNYKGKNKTKRQFNNIVVLLMALQVTISLGTLKLKHNQIYPLASSETLTFIRHMSHPAQKVSQAHGLYTSVMIAQAILESQNGKSHLSQSPYYNFFGVKGSYNGKSAILPTMEDDGNGKLYQIDAKFKSYGKPINSLKDYANVLEDPLYKSTHKWYSASYQEATQALTGTYATDTNYNVKLNQLIAYYHLYLFDYVY